MTNLTQHPCSDKCSEFNGEQCNHCLVRQIEKREFDLGLAPDDAYVKTDFAIGDAVVSLSNEFPLQDKTHHLIAVYGDQVWIQTEIGVWTVNKKFVRHAAVAELNVNRRLTEAEIALTEVP